MSGDAPAIRSMIRMPTPVLIQKSVLICSWVISLRWMVAMPRPKSLNISAKAVKAVTMLMSPKCSGVSRRAKTTVPASLKTLQPISEIAILTPPLIDFPARSRFRCSTSPRGWFFWRLVSLSLLFLAVNPNTFLKLDIRDNACIASTGMG